MGAASLLCLRQILRHQRDIVLRRCAAGCMDQQWFALVGRFGDLHGAADAGFEDGIIPGVVQPIVSAPVGLVALVHGKKTARKPQAGVTLPDLIHLLDQLRETIERELVDLDRYEHIVCGHKRIDDAHIDVRGIVDDTEVVCIPHRVERPPEPVVPAPAHVDEQRAVRRKQGHVCGDQVDPRNPGRLDHLSDVQPGLGEQLGDAGPVIAVQPPELGRVALLVVVDHQDALMVDRSQHMGDIDRADCLGDPALQVDNVNHSHAATSKTEDRRLDPSR